jgi:L-2-hydroxyglutarate oxidase LhgO
MVLIGGTEKHAILPLDSSLLFHSTNQHHQIQLATYCLPYIRLPKMSNHYTFTLKMATLMFAETFDNSQHLKQLNPKNQRYTLNKFNSKRKSNWNKHTIINKDYIIKCLLIINNRMQYT